MKALVTGGAGFIGSHLVDALIARGYEVNVLDDFSSGKLENLGDNQVTLFEGDVADLELVVNSAEGCDVIFHLAAYVSAPNSLVETELTHRSNVTGTFNVFEAARLAGVPHVVYASTSALYGNLPGLPKREDAELQTITPYALSKLVAEHYAKTYCAAYGISSVGTRFFNVFGPRQDPSSPYSGVLSIFCQRVLAGLPITIYGDGGQTRDFVFVEDVVQALLLAAAVKMETPVSKVYNVGRGEQTSLLEIVEMLQVIAGRSVDVQFADVRDGDIRYSVSDISLICDVLDYQPSVTVREGLGRTCEWYISKSVLRASN